MNYEIVYKKFKCCNVKDVFSLLLKIAAVVALYLKAVFAYDWKIIKGWIRSQICRFLVHYTQN